MSLFRSLFFAASLAPLFFSEATLAEPVELASVIKKAHAASTALAFDKYNEMQSAAEDALKTTNEWIKENPNDKRLASVKRLAKGLGYLAAKHTEKEWRARVAELQAGLLELVRGDAKLVAEWKLYYCPMVKRYWTQPKGEAMANAYMGTEMLDCGVEKKWVNLPAEVKGFEEKAEPKK